MRFLNLNAKLVKILIGSVDNLLPTRGGQTIVGIVSDVDVLNFVVWIWVFYDL